MLGRSGTRTPVLAAPAHGRCPHHAPRAPGRARGPGCCLLLALVHATTRRMLRGTSLARAMGQGLRRACRQLCRGPPCSAPCPSGQGQVTARVTRKDTPDNFVRRRIGSGGRHRSNPSLRSCVSARDCGGSSATHVLPIILCAKILEFSDFFTRCCVTHKKASARGFSWKR